MWAAALERNCPVLTHAWAGDPHCGPDLVRRVMKEHPDLRLIFGHALFPPTFDEAARLARDFEHVHLDVTTSNHAYGMIAHAVATVGSARIVFGTDLPFISAAGAVGKVLYAEIADADKRNIFSENARKLLAGIRT